MYAPLIAPLKVKERERKPVIPTSVSSATEGNKEKQETLKIPPQTSKQD